MKLVFIITLLICLSCTNHSKDKVVVERLFPDTTKSWAGHMTRDVFHLSREIEQNLHLSTLMNGSKNLEIRYWVAVPNFDPVYLFIIKESDKHKWRIRVVNFFAMKNDSLYEDFSIPFSSAEVDSLDINRFWKLKSQSDTKLADSYGCVDGSDVLMEMADSTRYKLVWYRCPDVNKYKDSSRIVINELWDRFSRLSIKAKDKKSE